MHGRLWLQLHRLLSIKLKLNFGVPRKQLVLPELSLCLRSRTQHLVLFRGFRVFRGSLFSLLKNYPPIFAEPTDELLSIIRQCRSAFGKLLAQ